MDWPHAPIHRINPRGTYIITGATYLKQHFFKGDERLWLLHNTLLELATRYDWKLQAWAVFSNHYHFVGIAPDTAEKPSTFFEHLHSVTANAINKLDNTPGRRVWYQYWDSLITYQPSYYARLHYTINNPVKHGLVHVASQYKWCSAAWFEQKADISFYKTIMGFKSDTVKVKDDF